MKINKDINKMLSHYAITLLDHNLSSDYCYHNVAHTLNTVNAADEIARAIGLTIHERDVVVAAAWLHDLGYIWRIDGHERVSALFAHHFLHELDVDTADVEIVKDCILATQYPHHQPAGILEQVVCDADMIHLGERAFFEKTALVREEWRLTRNLEFTDIQWNRMNLDFLSGHSFHTSYCLDRYERRKKKNIKKIERFFYSEQYT